MLLVRNYTLESNDPPLSPSRRMYIVGMTYESAIFSCYYLSPFCSIVSEPQPLLTLTQGNTGQDNKGRGHLKQRGETGKYRVSLGNTGATAPIRPQNNITQ